MPTPPKTSRPALVKIARSMVDLAGADALTLSEVALQAGIRPPSLYKHFLDRETLLKAVQIDIFGELELAIKAGLKGAAPTERLRTMAVAYRSFATERPHRYACIYGPDALVDAEIASASYSAAKPLFDELEKAGVSSDRILPLARTLTAFLHGFVSMEIAKAFRLGGDINEAFEHGLAILLTGGDIQS